MAKRERERVCVCGGGGGGGREEGERKSNLCLIFALFNFFYMYFNRSPHSHHVLCKALRAFFLSFFLRICALEMIVIIIIKDVVF